MPPKRRGAQAKSAPATKATQPEQPKPSSKPAPTSVPAPTPVPIPPLPPPPQPVESDANKVRKEWSKFLDAWYEPQKKKLVEKLQKDLLVKYKNLGSAKETQKLREMELFEKLDAIAQQLTQPARAEWERRLEFAQLREDQWNDMSGEEQQAVMSVFVGFFADDVDDMDDDDISADPSFEEEESVIEEPQYRGIPSYPPGPSVPSRPSIPPTPIRGSFEFVNPTSFADTMTPPNPIKNLPSLSMDHLATLGPSNAGRSAEPASASFGGMLGFQSWASEAGIVTQLPLAQSPKPPVASTFAQPLSARPRATDNMSRQPSTASSLSSPPLKTSSPQYSPPNPTTKFSPPINAENHPLGKRYIGPVILEEEPDPLDEELLKSKMADDYQQYKISLRIQMIYQFHAEAADVEIKLFETLLADEGTKESRARAVQEHETSMMRLREQKEEERKRLCAEERDKRREEIRQTLAQRRPPQNREIEPVAKVNPPKLLPDKMSVQPRSKATHQKENVPLSQPSPAVPPAKLEPPSVIKKTNSSLSQDEASANEAVFANAMAAFQGRVGVAGLTPAQVSLNEAVFSNAAAMLAQGQTGGKSTLQPPSIMKKSNSSRSQEYDIPQITVSFAEPSIVTTESAQVPSTNVKGKKGKKGQPAVQPPPAKPVAITEEMDAEPPPLAPSLWDAAAVAAKSVWGAASTSLSASMAMPNASVEECDADLVPAMAPGPPKGSVNAKKATPAAKKGKKVTIIEEPDVDADPIVSPPPSAKAKATKSAWGSVNGKSKVVPAVVEESEPEPLVPPPPVTPAWGKKATQASKPSTKPQLKVTISEELESEVEPSPAPAKVNKAKSAREPTATPSTGTGAQAGKKATQQQQAELRRGAASSGSKSVRVDTTPDPEDEWPGTTGGDSAMPGALMFSPSEEAEEEEEEGDSSWFNPENMSYWANFMAGQPEAETLAAPPPAEQQPGKHALWTPTMGEESEEEDEFGEADEDLATNMWMHYAISGGDVPTFTEEPHVLPEQREASLVEGRGKKKANANEVGNRAQQTSVFDRTAFAGQWPKMESWLSPPARGQSSGSTRVF